MGRPWVAPEDRRIVSGLKCDGEGVGRKGGQTRRWLGHQVILVAVWCIVVQPAQMTPKKRQKFARGLGLVELAAKAPPVLRAKDFIPAVELLREKGYSWRACAEWLKENAGIEIDHTSLMRWAEMGDGPDDE